MTGKNKKMNFSIFKGIKINKVQEGNWNPKLIRKVLENNPIELIKQLIDFMSNKCKIIGKIDESDKILFKTLEEMIK